MAFTFSEEHAALRAAVAEFLADHSDEAAVRALAETGRGMDPKVWRALAEQLGAVGLAVPEQYGGSGAGPVELAVVAEQLGRALFCGPYLSSAVFASTLLVELADDSANRDLLPALAGGERTATVALDEGTGDWDPASSSTAAERGADGWTVSGEKRYVLDGAHADTLLVVTQGARVFAVDRTAPGVTTTPLATLDGTRKLADVSLRNAPARPLAPDGDHGRAVRRALDTTAVMLAAEQAGGARAALDMAVEYAKQRYQFGRPIGSFQAVKHMCAELLVDVESAYSAAYYAAWALADSADNAEEATSLAAAFCSDAFVRAASDNIQIHGGIGFTWEHPAHLYLRRARGGARLLGSANTHRERYLREVTA
ncbi:acyl-CoA dehydrogenase family protein [Pseudonocardia eucalypti]|uniref:Acyl-CoA dehydrogenase family protein n=1 Tax=Pseudonocardia eucalypti TaxID=648755 RepID=A0ABP9PNK0_9PSEU|nr:alkylation response protein AidB-like acyl-CoA dehydrogenase [Pseudonocardia eucalypti]